MEDFDEDWSKMGLVMVINVMERMRELGKGRWKLKGDGM